MQKELDRPPPKSAPQLALGLVFGLVFGFLLQKGGVAKYEVLMGQFLLTDFTVMKIMLTAITVGMVGIFSMRALGLVKLHVKPTNYASNVAGGLLFGVGLGLLGYCPGTGAAALGQGNYDAIAGIAGLMAGSYSIRRNVGLFERDDTKNRQSGRIMLPDLIGMRLKIFLISFVPLLSLVLLGLEYIAI